MARYFGQLGYSEDVETPADSGIFIPTIVEKDHYGTIIREAKKFEGGFSINDNAVITNRLSIVGTQYAIDNAHNIKYATVNGAKIKVMSYVIERPRIILTLGGVWNGQSS